MPVTCAHLSISSLPQHFVCLPLSVELALLALSTSQYFVYLPLSIQRSQARSKYIHVCSGAPSLAHKTCTRYTERPNLRCWLQYLAALCLSAPFDTTLAGTQQVHPCMLKCAILGAQGLYTLYRKAELALLALSTSQYFVYLPLSIQRLQARSKYIHVCSGAPSLAHKACTRYTERPNLRFWLPAPSSQLPAPSSQLLAPSSHLQGPRLNPNNPRITYAAFCLKQTVYSLKKTD